MYRAFSLNEKLLYIVKPRSGTFEMVSCQVQHCCASRATH